MSKKSVLKNQTFTPLESAMCKDGEPKMGHNALFELSNGVYVILDRQTLPNKDIANFTKNCIKNNIKIFQLRDKVSAWKKVLEDARRLKKIIKNKALFIINDYPEICLLSKADGVHLGQEDLSLRFARKLLGKNKIIGISCHNIEQAEAAQKQGADYIGFGPIFKTPTKKDARPIGLKEINLLKKKIKIPFFLIGGIDLPEVKILNKYKIKRIAVCRALANTKNLKEKINKLRYFLK